MDDGWHSGAGGTGLRTISWTISGATYQDSLQQTEVSPYQAENLKSSNRLLVATLVETRWRISCTETVETAFSTPPYALNRK